MESGSLVLWQSVEGLSGGFTQRDAIELYEEDPDTKVIVLLGEIGGGSEEEAAAYIKAHVTKPVVSLIVGRNAPQGKSLGHAGANCQRQCGNGENENRSFARRGGTRGKKSRGDGKGDSSIAFMMQELL